MQRIAYIKHYLLMISIPLITTLSYAGAPVWTFTPLTATTISVPANGTATLQYRVTNQSSRSHTLAMNGITGVTQTTTGAGVCSNPFSLSGQSACILTLQINGSQITTGNTNGPVVCEQGSQLLCYRPSSSDTLNVTVTNAPGDTTLSASVSTLALSVNGASRLITITNTGSSAAIAVTYSSSPALPSGTTISPASCGTIAASSTCVLTITPGDTSSATAYNTSPTPITLTIAGSNTNTLSPTLNILTYASVYQGGYLFSIDDTTAATGSIGGKVAALTDQGPAYPNGTVWSSNGTGSSNVSYDIISGIDQTSTTSTPSPELSPPPRLSACNGATDGSCDSKNIVTYYNYYLTGGGTPPTPLTDYSAGLCANYTIDSAGKVPCDAENACYTGWFLPSICEMGPDSSGNDICTAPPLVSKVPNIVDNLPLLLGDGSEGGTCTAGAGCISGYYWSSTEAFSYSKKYAWFQNFASGGGSSQGVFDKDFPLGVRCSRALTP